MPLVAVPVAEVRAAKFESGAVLAVAVVVVVLRLQV